MLLDEILKHISALWIFEQLADSWDSILIYILTSKLDSVSYRAWEIHSSNHIAPTFKELCECLQSRCNMLTSISLEVSDAKQLARSKMPRSTWSKPTNVTMLFAKQRNCQNPKCGICRQSHHTFPCQKHISADSARRMQLVKKAKLCENCLCQFHVLKDCRTSSCKLCQKRHDMLLHIDKPKEFLPKHNKCQD